MTLLYPLQSQLESLKHEKPVGLALILGCSQKRQGSSGPASLAPMEGLTTAELAICSAFAHQAAPGSQRHNPGLC